MSKYNRIKGTQDIYGDEMKYWHFVEGKTKEVFSSYCFKEVRTPIFEMTDLFARSIGDNTDVVQKEMYTFEDKGKRSVTLRPEGTAPVVRAYVENSFMNEGSPLKLFYNGSMFRYEKPQSGRLREFHQIGAEIFGSNLALADAEVISLIYALLKTMGLNNFIVKINSVGCPKCREEYKNILKEYFKDIVSDLCDDCQIRYDKNIMRLVDCKKDKDLVKDAPSILDYLCEECKVSFDSLREYLDLMGVPYEIDSSIVRGLDYYTKTAFEVEHKNLGAQGVIAAGGRYDLLVKELNGPDTPAVGFAMGVERAVLALKAEGIDVGDNGDVDVYIVCADDSALKKGLEIVSILRKEGIKTFLNISKRNFGAQMKHANKVNAKFSVIIGADEVENNYLTIKDMSNGEQTKVQFSWFSKILKEKLNNLME